MLFLIFIVGCIFLGVIGAFFLAPVVIARNNKLLKEIKQKVDEFGPRVFADEKEKEAAKKQLMRELIELKGKITEDLARQEAADVMSLL